MQNNIDIHKNLENTNENLKNRIQDNEKLQYIHETLHKNFIATFGETEYQNWLKELKISTKNNSHYIISTSSSFIYNKITTKYQKFIEYIFQSNGFTIEIQIHKEQIKSNKETKINSSNNKITKNTKIISDIFNTKFNPNFTFEQFVYDRSNEFAYHSAKTLSNNIIQNTAINRLNPLYICGPVGLGKTHLLHAIAQHIITNKKEINIIYISAEKFMYEFIKSLRNNNITTFKESLRNIDVLLFDDIQFLANKNQTLSELEQTFNALTTMNKTIVLSADRPPKDLEINNRMKSRLLGGLVADIGHSNYDLRLSILKSKLSKLNIHIEDNILEYLAKHITANIRELEGALHKVIEYDKILNEDITISHVKNILHRSIKSNKNLSIEHIVTCIAKYYKTNKTDIVSHNRARKTTRIRQIAMYICRTCTGESLTNIGNYFSGRGHTAVIHASNNITKILATDVNANNDINNIKRIIHE